jgi:AP-1 complex subunit beta-1
LALLVQIADADNVAQILPELADYAKEVDVDFCRRAIRTLGTIAAKLPDQAADQALEIFATLAETDVRYVAQEVLVTLRSLLRRIPGAITVNMLSRLIRDPEIYDDSDSKAALLWLVGEHGKELLRAGKLDPIQLLLDLLDSFKVEAPSVQAELFTTCLKLYLVDPENYRSIMLDLVARGKASVENIDCRDRAILYERLLTLDPALLRSLQLDLSVKPPVQDALQSLPPNLLRMAIADLGCLSSVYQREPKSFLIHQPASTAREDSLEAMSQEHDDGVLAAVETEQPGIPYDLLDGLGLDNSREFSPSGQQPSKSTSTPSNLIDLLS